MRSAAAVAACALLVAACDSGKKHGGAPGAPSSSGPTSSVTSATSVTPSGPAPSGAALANPGAFASDLTFTDISKQVNNALKGVTNRKLSFARAVMKVPLDWANPNNGKTVSITVLRVRSQSQHDRIGSLVVNPGVVDVCVLEPETDWDPADMNERIAALHSKFEETLARWPA